MRQLWRRRPGRPWWLTRSNFDAIYRSLEDYDNWVYEHPNPQLVDNYLSPLCDCYKQAQDSLTALVHDGQHISPPGIERIDTVQLISQLRPGWVVLRVVVEGVTGTIVDAQGRAVQSVAAIPPRAFRKTIRQLSDGRWRITQSMLLPAGS